MNHGSHRLLFAPVKLAATALGVALSLACGRLDRQKEQADAPPATLDVAAADAEADDGLTTRSVDVHGRTFVMTTYTDAGPVVYRYDLDGRLVTDKDASSIDVTFDDLSGPVASTPATHCIASDGGFRMYSDGGLYTYEASFGPCESSAGRDHGSHDYSSWD